MKMMRPEPGFPTPKSIDAVASHLRLAVRSLSRTPGFVIGVVLTLALGIGATSTPFRNRGSIVSEAAGASRGAQETAPPVCKVDIDVVARALTKEGWKILGSQIRVATSKGLRIIDHLAESPTGERVAVEVKSGNAVRTASQVAKDNALASEGGRIVGSAPAGVPKHLDPTQTTVMSAGEYDLTVLRKALLREIGKGMPRFEFPERPKPRTMSFYRRTVRGWDVFGLHTVVHPGLDFDVTAHVGVRFEPLERLVSELDDKFGPDEVSVGAEMGNVAIGEQRRWTVRSEEDVSAAATSILETFARIGLPYLRRFSDPAAILDVLRPRDGSAYLYSPFPGPRCIRSVGLTRLLGAPPDLDDAIVVSRDFLMRRDERAVARFDRFVNRLRRQT